jgi:hypothetical protein
LTPRSGIRDEFYPGFFVPFHKNIFSFVKFIATKEGKIQKIPPPPPAFVLVGSEIRDVRKSGFGVRDKHPGSATLHLSLNRSCKVVRCLYPKMARRAVTDVTVRDKRNKGRTPKKLYDFWQAP